MMREWCAGSGPDGDRHVSWRPFLHASSACCGFCFLLGLVLANGYSFVGERDERDLGVSLSALTACHVGNCSVISTWEFCYGDHTTCHEPSCGDVQRTFCGLHLTTYFVTVPYGMVLVMACVLSVCILQSPLEAPLSERRARLNVFSHIVAVIAHIVVLVVWRCAKGQLPDWSNVTHRWVYLPGHSAEHWKMGPAFAFAIPMLFIVLGSTRCACIALKRIRAELDTEDDAALESAPDFTSFGDDAEQVGSGTTTVHLDNHGVPPPAQPAQADPWDELAQGMKAKKPRATPLQRVEIKPYGAYTDIE